MELPTKEQAIASNREAWNDSARHHMDSSEWQALLKGVEQADFSCLDDTLTALLAQTGVDGKEVLQLGCNNGRESLSLFALGARSVVGVDQSGAFLEQARELASRSPHAPQFIEADIHHLPAQLQERFDLALITIGVLNWMPDIGEFFRHVARTLKPGGALVVYETHPFLEMFDPEAADPFARPVHTSVANRSCSTNRSSTRARSNSRPRRPTGSSTPWATSSAPPLPQACRSVTSRNTRTPTAKNCMSAISSRRRSCRCVLPGRW